MADIHRYAWRDAAGRITSLMDSENYVVTRYGIRGFADTTDERTLIPGKRVQLVAGCTAKARELGFTVLIIGGSAADVQEKRDRLLRIFSQPGTLIIHTGIRELSIGCYCARGSPDIADGIAPDATSQKVALTLIAPDPYFYGEEMTVSLNDGMSVQSVYNPGTADLTPCTLVLSENAATNVTAGQTMQALEGQTVAGASVTVTDTGISATLDDANVIGRFTYDSAFWMLVPGFNVLEGVASVRFRPRWMGV